MSVTRSAKPGCRLFVGNLDYNAGKNELKKIFSEVGRVLDVYTPFDKSKEGFKNKGYAFVEMGSAEEAAAAIEVLDGIPGPGGRKLSIRDAQPRD